MSSVIARLPFDYVSLRDAWRRIANSVNRTVTVLQEHEDAANPHPQYLQKGYGGLFLSSPWVTLIDLTTTPAPIGGDAYDSVLTPNPVGVTQDLANGRLTINEQGLWVLYVSVIGVIVQVTSNASNTIALAAYNFTDGVLGNQPTYFTVPRYGETFSVSQCVPLRVDAAVVGKEFVLAVWTLNATPSIDITEITAVNFHVSRVAGPEAL